MTEEREARRPRQESPPGSEQPPRVGEGSCIQHSCPGGAPSALSQVVVVSAAGRVAGREVGPGKADRPMKVMKAVLLVAAASAFAGHSAFWPISSTLTSDKWPL